MSSREEAARKALENVEQAIERHNAQSEMLLSHLEQAQRELEQAEEWTLILANREPEPEEAPSIFEGARQEYQKPAITNATPEQVNEMREQMKYDEPGEVEPIAVAPTTPSERLEFLRQHCIEMHKLFDRYQRAFAEVAMDAAQDHAELARKLGIHK